jgi:hypothetical protein
MFKCVPAGVGAAVPDSSGATAGGCPAPEADLPVNAKAARAAGGRRLVYMGAV